MLVALLLVLLGSAVDAAAPPDTVVVCPAEFRAVLEPWIQLRTSEGHVIQVVSNDGSADDIRARIRSANRVGKLRAILLVGGADPERARNAEIRRRSIPPFYEGAKVNVRFGSEPYIATDNGYADLDGDGLPDVAIGRLPVRSSAELAVVVKKIVAYEQNPDYRRWRGRIHFVAGTSGFGPAVDTALQLGARQIIEGGVPPGYRSSLTLADWHSNFCPDPRRFHADTLASVSGGSWLWVYLGHGRATEVDRMRLPGGRLPVLDASDAKSLRPGEGSPIALFMACYTGAFDGTQRCLADELLHAEGGPVAIVSGSRVTMPYGMAVLGAGLLDELFVHHTTTLGEALLRAKRHSVDADGPTIDARRFALDTMERTFGPGGEDLVAERREHMELFNLIGDPLLRLRYPSEAHVEIAGAVRAGEPLTLRINSSIAGQAMVELSPITDQASLAESRTEFVTTDDALSAYQTAYERANQPMLDSVALTLDAGRVTVANLKVPADALGKFRLRVFVANADGFALGATDFEVTHAKTTSADSEQSRREAAALHRAPR